MTNPSNGDGLIPEKSHTADLPTRYRYRQEGAKAEQERIIKLLEDRLHYVKYQGITSKPTSEQPFGETADVELLIALIKGEQK